MVTTCMLSLYLPITVIILFNLFHETKEEQLSERRQFIVEWDWFALFCGVGYGRSTAKANKQSHSSPSLTQKHNKKDKLIQKRRVYRLARLLPSANCWNKWNESKDDETKANEQSLVEWSSAAVEGPLAHNPQTTQAHWAANQLLHQFPSFFTQLIP